MNLLSHKTTLTGIIVLFSLMKTYGQVHYASLKRIDKTALFEWQTHNANGTFTFGISRNKKHADSIVSNFKKRNKHTKYKPYYSSVEPITVTDKNLYLDFINNFPKQYLVLDNEEILAISLCRKKGVKDAAYFLKSTKKCTNLKFCIGKIWELNNKTKQLSFL